MAGWVFRHNIEPLGTEPRWSADDLLQIAQTVGEYQDATERCIPRCELRRFQSRDADALTTRRAGLDRRNFERQSGLLGSLGQSHRHAADEREDQELATHAASRVW